VDFICRTLAPDRNYCTAKEGEKLSKTRGIERFPGFSGDWGENRPETVEKQRELAKAAGDIPVFLTHTTREIKKERLRKCPGSII
jgi:hypothetical protein